MWASWARPTSRGSRSVNRSTAAPPTRHEARNVRRSSYPQPVGHQSCVASDVANSGVVAGQNAVPFRVRRKASTSLVAIPADRALIAADFSSVSGGSNTTSPACNTPSGKQTTTTFPTNTPRLVST